MDLVYSAQVVGRYTELEGERQGRGRVNNGGR